jgi:probable rRNA maturation factor
MQIEVLNQQNDLSIDSKSAKKILRFLLAEMKVNCDEISLYFIETEAMCNLHQKFFDDPTPTDCISFPIDDNESSFYRVLGEIFVCPYTAIKYAKNHEKDPYEEVCLYIVHGLLHLLGFDDIDENDRAEMRKKEKWCMNKLKEKKVQLKPAHGNI